MATSSSNPAAAIGGGLGGILGGIIGNAQASGDRGQANNDMVDANNIIQSLQAADDMSRPILLQKYQDQGLITPEQAQNINQTISQTAGIKTGGAGQDAQLQALKQLSQVSQQGMSAQDRAALNQVQQQTNAQTNGNIQSILQNATARGQATSGSTLAAQLAAAQQGANAQSQGANQVAGQAQQNALNATAQMGGLGGQVENTQFGENLTKAQAADQMNRFNIQNQLGVQQQNVNANNNAQYANLANQQNVANQNTSAANQEAYAQRAGEQQNFNNQNQLAGIKSGSLNNQANNLNNQGTKIAQGDANLGAGLGGMAASAFFSQGGNVGNASDYRNGGHVPGKAKMPGDHPANDTVDAKLSPGEIVIPRSIAKSSLGDKLLDLLNHHHEVKKHLDKIDEKASKDSQKFSDGGQSQSLGNQISNYFSAQAAPQAQPQQAANNPQMQDAMRQAFHFAKGGQIPAMPPMAPPQPMLTQQPPMKQQIPMLPPQTSAPMALDKNDPTYLAKLMEQYKSIGKSTKKHPNLNGPVRKFSSGGGVEDDGPISTFKNAINKAFSTPAPVIKQPMSLDDKNDLIRKQNTERANGQRDSIVTNDPDSTLNRSYADGTDPKDPNDISNQEPLDMSDVVSSKSPGEEDVEFNRPEVITGSAPKKLEDIEEDKDPESKALENKYENEEFEAEEKAKDDKSDDSDKDKKVVDSKDKDDQDREPASEDKDDSDDNDDSDDDSDEETTVASSNDRTKKPLNKSDELKAAQDKRASAQQAANIAKFGNIAGAGIARVNALPAGTFDSIAKQGALGVQDYAEQIANQKNDANSPVSVAFRDYMKKYHNINLPETTSAADGITIAPYVVKDSALQAGIQKAILQSQTKLQGIDTQQAGADKRAKDKNDLTEKEIATKQESNKIAKQQNQDNKVNTDFEKMTKTLSEESASSRTPLGKAALIKQGAERLEALGQQYKNTNQLDNRQIAELARGLDSMLSGGAATISGANHLLPSSASGNLSKIEEYITNIPQGARQKEFVDRMMDTVKREKDLSSKQIKSALQDANLGFTHLQKADPNRYNAILKAKGLDTGNSQSASASSKTITQAQADAYSQAHGPDGLQKLLSSGYSIGQ